MTAPSTETARRIRLAGWFGFVAILGIAEIVSLSSVPGAERQLVIDVVGYLLPILLALGTACLLTLTTTGVEHRLWGLVAIACACLLVSEAYVTWYFYAVDWRGPQLPAPFELLQVAAAILFLAIIQNMTEFGQTPLVARIRVAVDVVSTLVVVAAAAYWWVMLPLFQGIPMGGWPVAAISSVYLMIGAALVGGALAMTISWRTGRWRTWERLLVGALGLYGIGLLFEPWWYATTLTSPYPPEGGVLSALLGFGFYLLFMAMVYRLTSSSAGAAERWPVPRIRLPWIPTAWPIAVSCALPLLGLAYLRIGHLPEGAFIVALTALLGVLLVARSWLSSVERVQLRSLSITDPVSGAYNLRYLHERLAEELAAVSAGDPAPALVVFDIDDFAHINRLWGHELGDDVLRRVAEEIAKQAGGGHAVYRVGSDEFAVALLGMSEDEVTSRVRVLCARVMTSAFLPTTRVRLSAGIAFYPRHGADVDQLLSHALISEQLARASESAEPVVYDPDSAATADASERLASARRRSHRAVVLALSDAVDGRHTYTEQHSLDVAELASSLAQVLNLPSEQVRAIELAARVHDVGKIGVRDEVLLKAGTLSHDEYELVKAHPTLGERILAPTELQELLPLVRHHHERWDGEGYPDGLRGPECPVGARIIAVCDAFQAMTSPRPHREALMFEDAIGEIERGAGTQFDPDVAAAFVRMVQRLRSPVASDVGLTFRVDPGA